MEPNIKAGKFVLYHTIDQFDLSGFKHFGDFFDDRLTIYFSDNPDLSIGKARVKFLMLYFIDTRLVKVRYHLDYDISNYLVDSLGVCKIKSSDVENMAILKSGTILLKSKTGIHLNPELSDYELIWDRYVVESRFVVDPDHFSLYDFDSTKSEFVYIDQLKSYKKRLHKLEKTLKSKKSQNPL